MTSKREALHELAATVISKIKAAGFTVYVRPNEDGRALTHCHYTDGKRIAYAQWEPYRGVSLSSVYRPCSANGTGARFGDGIAIDSLNAETLSGAFGWTIRRYAGEVSPVFYKSMDEYLSASKWNSEQQIA